MREIQYLWSDAWLLQAVILAARHGPASLADVIAAADSVNHALPNDDELHGAFFRLTTGGFIEEVNSLFAPTSRVPHDTVEKVTTGGWQKGRAAAADLLQAEDWSEEKNLGDPRNAVKYPGLTRERLLRAASRRQ